MLLLELIELRVAVHPGEEGVAKTSVGGILRPGDRTGFATVAGAAI